mmetsp:Transcript_117042/g.372632  ORF Transcript_117042/g.372632 Transcript_117042/m.372632 type:complete len:216 (-) Transcript_117042:323-970(-)
MVWPLERMNCKKASSTTFFESSSNTLMTCSMSMPVDTAALNDNIVNWYSWMTSGLLTGSATTIKKSVTSATRGWKVSKMILPLGSTQIGRLACPGTSCKSRRSSRCRDPAPVPPPQSPPSKTVGSIESPPPSPWSWSGGSAFTLLSNFGQRPPPPPPERQRRASPSSSYVAAAWPPGPWLQQLQQRQQPSEHWQAWPAFRLRPPPERQSRACSAA